MFEKFYTEMIVPITQLTDAQLHLFITVIASFIVIVAVAIMIVFFVVNGLRNVAKSIFMSLFISVLLLFNFFWEICFMNDGWEAYFWLAPVFIYVLIRAGIRLYRNNKERKNQDDNI